MDFDYFNRWTEEMAYYLGWIWADGCINQQGQLSISCISEDEYLISGFKRAIGSHHKISRYQDPRWGKPSSHITVCGKNFVRPLTEKHGVLPRKSFLDCEFPSVPDRVLPHFVRGHFDGDGSLVITCQGFAKVSIVGTRKFIKGLEYAIFSSTGMGRQRIKRHVRSKRAYYLEYCRKEQILAFLNFIYPQGQYPFMKRKRDKADTLRPQLEKFWENFGIDFKRNKWRLRLHGGKHIGYFASKDQALEARTSIIGSVDFRKKK